jgi:transient receptor potential cation channel subfamily A protein 1
MEIKSEEDDVDEGVSVKEMRPLSALLSENPSRWNSPRIRKKLRAATSFNKSLSS